MVSTKDGRALHGEGSEHDWFGEETVTDGNSTHISNKAKKTLSEQNRFLQTKPKATTHGKRKEILDSADYAFTGSYYNTHRNIMNFDPIDLMPKYKGVYLFLFNVSCPYHADHVIKHHTAPLFSIALHSLASLHCVHRVSVRTYMSQQAMIFLNSFST
jgi:hypothetical protein